jgi:leader peptidase (prepilin peptidase)/N-methyltransferase
MSVLPRTPGGRRRRFEIYPRGLGRGCASIGGLETLFIIWLAFLGLSFGSFLNVVIARLPEGLSIVSPRSRCPKCGHQLPWYENVPVISWLALRGKCSGCKAPISPRYILVELLTGTLFVVALQRFGWDWPLVNALIFICLLIPLVFIDAEHWVLPFELTLPGIAAGLLLHVPLGLDAFFSACIGATVGFLVFRVMEFLGWLYAGTEALGAGDKYLLAMIGATLGWRPILAVVMLSAVQGSIYGVLQLLRTGRAGPAAPRPSAGAHAAPAVVIPLAARDASVFPPEHVHAHPHAAAAAPGGGPVESGLGVVSKVKSAEGALGGVGEAGAPGDGLQSEALLEGPLTLRQARGERPPGSGSAVDSAPGAGTESTGGADHELEEESGREPWTPAFLRRDLPWWKRLGAIPYAILWQDIPDPPPLTEEGEEPDWVPLTTSLPFGPWIGLAALEVMLAGPALAQLLAGTPFRFTAELLFAS